MFYFIFSTTLLYSSPAQFFLHLNLLQVSCHIIQRYNCIQIQINYRTMSSMSVSKMQLMRQINESKNAQVHPYVKSMLETVHNESYSLAKRFKNLEDPLAFIHNQNIQHLVEKTEESSFKLKKEMDDVSQFSKSMFKKIIARQGNEFDFQNIQQEGKSLAKSQIKDTELLKAQSKCRLKDIRHNFIKDPSKKNITKTQVFEPFEPLSQYKHHVEHVRQTKYELNKNAKTQLTFSHIKILDTPKFEKDCKNVEFYEILKEQKNDRHHFYNQEYDIQKSKAVNRLCDKIPLELIQSDLEHGAISQELYYDFDLSLRFWRQANNQEAHIIQLQGNKGKPDGQQITEEKTMALFERFKRKQINANNLCDLAMGKISVKSLKFYLNLRNEQKIKTRGRNDENLYDQYRQLLRQYNYLNDMKTKIKSQRGPIKYVDSESQTIKILEQTDFDNYFNQDFKQLFELISKLNQVRQNAILNKKTKNRLVMVKNACQEINNCLFKVLTLILKGQKFYPRDKANEQYYAPFFTYRDLFDADNREQVERKILELVYTKIGEFQCEFVDGIAKSDMITLYVQEREKSNRIIDIINAR